MDELKTQHAAAVKALEAENKKRLDDKKKVNGSKTASTPPNPNPAAEFKDGKPVFGSKGTPPAGESRSLFDTATDQADAVEHMITISDVGQGLLRVNIIPRKLVVDGSSDENTGALTTPLSITGKAEELDKELPGQLATFTESIARTGSNLDELKTQHAAAVKALKPRTRRNWTTRRR